MNTRPVRLQFDTTGKAPKRYGKNAWKVSWESALLMTKAGWTSVGKGRYYHYVVPPNGELTPKNPTVTVEVPTDEEIERVAMAAHRDGTRHKDVIDGWVVRYCPAEAELCQVTGIYELSRKGYRQVQGPEPPVLQEHAEFTWGVSAPWSVTLLWEQGDKRPPTWKRREPDLSAER